MFPVADSDRCDIGILRCWSTEQVFEALAALFQPHQSQPEFGDELAESGRTGAHLRCR